MAFLQQFVKLSQCVRPLFMSGARQFSRSPQCNDLRIQISPSKFEKILLVRAKSYPSVDQVPERVSAASLKRAKDIFRGHMCVYLTLASIVGCVIMMRSGRKLRESGDSLDKRAIEWQRKAREEGLKEEEAERLAAEKAS